MMSDHPDSANVLSPRYAMAWAMLACAVAALLLAHPALTGEFLVNPRSDQYIAGYAFREFAAGMLRGGEGFPLWNPYLLGGLPYVDAMHGDIFYPTFLLRMLFPTDVAMTWGMIIHLWAAGVGAYALFRAHGLAFHAALVGGLAYMLSGMVAGLVSPGHDGKLFICALLPFTMLVLRHGVRDGRRWAWGVLALLAGLGILTPHPQLFQYLLLVSGAYALFIAFGEGGDGAPSRPLAVRRLVFALGAISIGFLIGAIQFWPVLNYVDASPRAGGGGWEHAISYSMPPEELVNTVLPQFSGILDRYWGRNGIHLHSEYIGLPVLLLAAGAFVRGSVGNRVRWFWLGTAIVAGLWALGGFTPFYRLIYAIVPGTKFFRAPSTMMYVTALAVSALAAIGASRVLAGQIGRRFVIGAAVATGVVALLGVTGVISTAFASLVPPERFDAFDANRPAVRAGAIRVLIFSAMLIALLQALVAKRLAAPVAGWLLAALVMADQWSVVRSYWMFSPPASEEFASDPAIDLIKSDSTQGRVLTLQPQSRDPMLYYDGLMAHGVRIVFGYHGNSLARYDRLTRSEGGIRLGTPMSWELLNIQWIYTELDSLPIDEFERVLGPVPNAYGSNVYLYRHRTENPLAWIVPLAVKAPDAVALATLAQESFPVRSLAIFDSSSSIPGGQPSVPPPLAIRAKTVNYRAGTIDIELDTPAPEGSALVVSENYYPGWTATVDGQAASAERVNYTLLGVPLAAGARRIELRFTSPTYQTGKRVTLIAIFVALALAVGGVALDRRRGVAA